MDDKTLNDLISRMPTVAHGDSGLTLITCPVRLSYASLDKPRTPKGSNKDPRYSAACLIPSAADMSLYAAAFRAAWDAGKIAGQPTHKPFKLQAEHKAKRAAKGKTSEGFSDSGYFFNAETKNPPTFLDAAGNVMQGPDAAAAFYSGCWVRVKFTLQAYDQAGNQGVKAWLNAVQFIADDKRLGGDSADGFGAAQGVPAGMQSSQARGPAAAPANVADAFAM